jgi:hypothetical protein
MQDNDRISFSGQQCLCAYDSEHMERIYIVTIRVKKSFREADFPGLRNMNPVAGCGGKVSVSFADFPYPSTLGGGPRGFDLYIECQSTSWSPSDTEGWMSVVNLDDGHIKDWEQLHVSENGSYRTKWFKNSPNCAHT